MESDDGSKIVFEDIPVAVLRGNAVVYDGTIEIQRGQVAVSDYISTVDEFAKLMKERLKAKEAKWGRPEDYTLGEMRLGLLDEIREWGRSIDTEQEDEELLDVACYAFLIWYLRHRGRR